MGTVKQTGRFVSDLCLHTATDRADHVECLHHDTTILLSVFAFDTQTSDTDLLYSGEVPHSSTWLALLPRQSVGEHPGVGSVWEQSSTCLTSAMQAFACQSTQVQCSLLLPVVSLHIIHLLRIIEWHWPTLQKPLWKHSVPGSTGILCYN